MVPKEIIPISKYAVRLWSSAPALPSGHVDHPLPADALWQQISLFCATVTPRVISRVKYKDIVLNPDGTERESALFEDFVETEAVYGEISELPAEYDPADGWLFWTPQELADYKNDATRNALIKAHIDNRPEPS